MDTSTSLLQKKKILVVEDEQYLRDLYVHILQDEGYLVESVADGQEGYAKMQTVAYDLILLDVMLPRMDGLTILEKLRNSNTASINKKIILMTNLGQDNVIARALSLGVQGYLVKSDYTPDQLLQEVKNNLQGY